MPVRTAVITAAGVGTRFLPISKSVPKEMLPLVDRPVLQYAVEQAAEAGIERVVLVTSRGKTAMEDYFDVAPELERTLRERGNAKLEPVERVGRMTRVIAVRQPEPLGLGHAVLMAKEAVGNEPFIVYLPDEILLGEPSVTRQMLDAYDRRGNAIGVVEVPWDDVSRYGVVEGEPLSDRETLLTRSVEKPPRDQAPSNLAIVGPYVFSPAIFDCLEEITTGAIGELQLTDAIALLAQREPVHAFRFEGERFDAGTPLGLMQTAVEIALRHPDYADAMRAWLKELAERETNLK
ncbi:MAG: UTP--glucose-1-phosphate uridylyltransferase [Chloroflexota bacterium]|nr:UTP--glucose-1-phosphate uridylyltransferase [Chloroflexota bacterium]MDE2886512.1 UTP--glucose-1-phosphate uridylyltransferase [Chloroflexota bacterium]